MHLLYYAGCMGGVGRGVVLSSGLGGGGGHGGQGGTGCSNGVCVDGGISYGSADLPCELGSGSGNDSFDGSTTGGGIIGKQYYFLMDNSGFSYVVCEKKMLENCILLHKWVYILVSLSLWK